MGLRLMAFGQLNKWFEHCDISSVQKRSYSDDDNQSNEKRMEIYFILFFCLVSVKRQCIKSENIDEQ